MQTPSPQTVDLLYKELPQPPRPTLEQRRASVASTNSWHESPIVDALTILPGRPQLDHVVPRFVASAQGETLVVTCGPTPMAQAVRWEVTKLFSAYPVSLEVALFEC